MLRHRASIAIVSSMHLCHTVSIWLSGNSSFSDTLIRFQRWPHALSASTSSLLQCPLRLTVKTRNSTYDPSSICTSAHKNDGSIDRLPRRERHSAQSDFNTGITGSEDKTKIDVAVKMLPEQGHTVHAQMRGNAFWF